MNNCHAHRHLINAIRPKHTHTHEYMLPQLSKRHMCVCGCVCKSLGSLLALRQHFQVVAMTINLCKKVIA